MPVHEQGPAGAVTAFLQQGLRAAATAADRAG
jgi:hypothetical protein